MGGQDEGLVHIAPFGGKLARFPDWSDRILAKLSKAHPRLEELLSWAEPQVEPVTRANEVEMSTAGFDVAAFSCAIYDVLLERIGPRLFDKRLQSGILVGSPKRFGKESADAQLAKLHLYCKPARCTDVRLLGEALDRREALGRDITRPVDDDVRLLALRELVPESLVELMTTQVALKSYPEALMYVRRHLTDQRHAVQVEAVRERGHAPMDISAFIAAIGRMNGGRHELGTEEAAIAALRDREGKGDSRECYNCGKVGHLARDCPDPKKTSPTKGKAKGTGKGKPAQSLTQEGDEGLAASSGPRWRSARCRLASPRSGRSTSASRRSWTRARGSAFAGRSTSLGPAVATRQAERELASSTCVPTAAESPMSVRSWCEALWTSERSSR